jgi:hypothetical protein
MGKLTEIRNQEMMCRERALLDTDHRDFWLTKTNEWARQAVDEIAFQLRANSEMSSVSVDIGSFGAKRLSDRANQLQ